MAECPHLTPSPKETHARRRVAEEEATKEVALRMAQEAAEALGLSVAADPRAA